MRNEATGAKEKVLVRLVRYDSLGTRFWSIRVEKDSVGSVPSHGYLS